MKICVIGDVHQTTYYKPFLEKKDDYDKIIFLGDYFDFHGPEPEGDKFENFEFICKAKEENPDKIDLLLGNHDMSYLLGERTGNYQYYHSFKIKEIINKYIDLFKIAVEYDGYVFSHAGISIMFKKFNKIDTLEDLNNALKDRINIFRFSLYDYSGYGDHRSQSPMWIRPNSLMVDAAYPKQVVGHTAVADKIKFLEYKGNKVIFTDTPKHNCIFEMDTNKEYEYENLETEGGE